MTEARGQKIETMKTKNDTVTWCKLISDGGDGLFLAVYVGDECVYLGNNRYELPCGCDTHRAGMDYFGVMKGQIGARDVASWEEPEWLRELYVSYPALSEAEVRRLVINGSEKDGLKPLDNGGDSVSSYGGLFYRRDRYDGTLLGEALDAAGVLESETVRALRRFSYDLRERADAASGRIGKFVGREVRLRECLRILDRYNARLLRHAEEMERMGRSITADDAVHVAGMFERVYRGVFGDGMISAGYTRRVCCADGSFKDVACPPCAADRVSVSARDISVEIGGGDEDAARLRGLGGELCEAVLRLCGVRGHMTDCGSREFDSRVVELEVGTED